MERKLQKREYREKAFKKILLTAIRQNPKGMTLEDMVIATGLAKDWVELALMSLLEDIPCRLKANKNGEILYIFDLPTKNNFSFKIFPKNQKFGNFFHKSLAYIFGEAHKRKDKLLTEKIILNYIKNNHGKIVVAEIVQLTGWSIKEAETQVVRLLANYQGEVEVSKEGIIIYIFEDLAKGEKKSSEISESLKIWERTIPEKVFNKNSEVENQKLQKRAKYLTGVSFLVPIATTTFFFGNLSPLLFWASASFPFLFATLGLALPALRKKWIHHQNDKIRLKNVERYILKAIFQKLDYRLSPEKTLQIILEEIKPKKNYLYWWNPKFDAVMYDIMMMLTCTYNKEAIFRKKANELEADIDVLKNGELSYEFERLQEELKVVKNMRFIETNQNIGKNFNKELKEIIN